MIKCPRCAQMVDETVRTTCPLCFTPIQPATDAATPPAQAAPDVTAVPSATGTLTAETGALNSPSASGVQSLNAPLPQTMGMNVGTQNPTDVRPLNAPEPLTGAQPLNGLTAPSLNAPASGGASSLPPLDMSPGLAPGTIRPLNGDIIQTGAPAPTVAPAATPGAPPSMGGAYIPPDSNTGPTSNRFSTMYEEPPEDKRGILHTLHGLLVAVMLIGVAGWGIWKIVIPKPGPKDQVQRFLTAAATDDYNTIYDVTDLTEDQQKQFPDAQTFADDAKKKVDQAKASPFGPFLTEVQKSLKAAKVGDAKVDNDTATVPITFSIAGQPMTQNISLKHVGGDWKISGGGSSSGNIPGLGGNFNTGGAGSGGFTGRAGGG